MIKFRLIKDNKIVGYERHIPGRMDGRIRHLPAIIHSKEENGSGWNIYSQIGNGVIDHDSKEQYIDKQDVNGQDVYQGDRVTCPNGLSYIVCLGNWRHIDTGEHYGWYLQGESGEGGGGKSWQWDIVDPIDIKVIGTIHDEVKP